MLFHLPDDAVEFPSSIPGLRFERNLVSKLEGPPNWFSTKLTSSPGPLISDFVTHEAHFSYSTYGIHVGQDDRLTFMGANWRRIEGHFVDCRLGSGTLHQKVSLRFAPSLYRRLIVPRGVAHTFDHLQYIVTRDEPIWYSDDNNRDWNIDNDLISVLRDMELSSFPVVAPNRYRLPDKAHLLLSRISQTLLENPKAYLARFKVNIGSEDTYVMLEPKSWAEDEHELRARIDLPAIPGVEIKRSRYALTGPKSWTLVPNTAACVGDVLVLPASPSRSSQKFCHMRTKKWYTFLTNEGLDVAIDFVDCRRDSTTFGLSKQLHLKCDPRISIAIEHGIAYAFQTDRDLLVRCEHELFADHNEPRVDLPLFGHDLTVLSETDHFPRLTLPTLRCPEDVIYLIARDEVSRSCLADS